MIAEVRLCAITAFLMYVSLGVFLTTERSYYNPFIRNFLGAKRCFMSEHCTTANSRSASCFAFGALCWAVRLAIPSLLVDRRLLMVSLALVFGLRPFVCGSLSLGT